MSVSVSCGRIKNLLTWTLIMTLEFVLIYKNVVGRPLLSLTLNEPKYYLNWSWTIITCWTNCIEARDYSSSPSCTLYRFFFFYVLIRVQIFTSIIIHTPRSRLCGAAQNLITIAQIWIFLLFIFHVNTSISSQMKDSFHIEQSENLVKIAYMWWLIISQALTELTNGCAIYGNLFWGIR